MATVIAAVVISAFEIKSAIAVFAIMAAASVVDSFLLPQIFAADLGTGIPNSARLSAERKINAKSAVEYSKSVYGRSIIAGNYAYVNSSSSNHILHTILATSYHPIDFVEDILWNEASVRKEFLTKHCWSGFTPRSTALPNGDRAIRVSARFDLITGPNSVKALGLKVYPNNSYGASASDAVDIDYNTWYTQWDSNATLATPGVVNASDAYNSFRNYGLVDIDNNNVFSFSKTEDNEFGLYGRAIEIISDSEHSGIYMTLSEIDGFSSEDFPDYDAIVLPMLYHRSPSRLDTGYVYEGNTNPPYFDLMTGETNSVRSINVLGGSTLVNLGGFNSVYPLELTKIMPTTIKNEWNGPRLRSIPHSYSKYLADIDQFAGTPQNQIIARGLKLYDPRLNTDPAYTQSIKTITVFDDSDGYYKAKIDVYGSAQPFLQNVNFGIAPPSGNSLSLNQLVYIEGVESTNLRFKIKGYYSVDVIIYNTSGDSSIYIRLPIPYDGTNVSNSIYSLANAIIQVPTWSNNWALCVRDYISNPVWGLDADYDEIDEDLVELSANYSDDLIYEKALPAARVVVGPTTFSYGVLYFTGNQLDNIQKYTYLYLNHDSGLSAEYTFNGTSVSPSWEGLSTSTDRCLVEVIDAEYYKETITEDHDDDEDTEDIIRRPRAIDSMLFNNWTINAPDDTYGTYIKVRLISGGFSSLFNALPSYFTNISLFTKRYTIDGEFGTGETPIAILESLVRGGAGAVAYTQGMYRIWAGRYTSPTYTITSEYLAGGFSIVNATGRDNVFNSVKGTYINASANWSATDFDEYTGEGFIEEDGDQYIPKDFDFKFVINKYTAQRLAKIYLAQVRVGMIVELSCNYKALEIPLYDNVYLDLSIPGADIFNNKIFKVVGWTMGSDEDTAVNLILREENSEVYEPWRLT